MIRTLIFLASLFFINICSAEESKPVTLNVIKTSITVDGKKSEVYDIVQDNGQEGYEGVKGQNFDVLLKNKTNVPVAIHWHGLILPNNQDGVAYITQLPIPPGKSQHYFFPLVQSGTYWMHSHYKLFEQQLMSAPLIINNPNDLYPNYKSITVMLQDFSFTSPDKIFANLKKSSKEKMASMHMDHDMNMSEPDLNDVDYDAFLANRHTLSKPEIIQVSARQKIRLRVINASAATNFWVNTGKLEGALIAVDGNNIKPIKNHKFQVAIAQRLDILLSIPNKKGTYPILAQVEGTKKQTGILLVTPDTKIVLPSKLATSDAPALNDDQERQIHPLNSVVTKPVTKTLHYTLEGNMSDYVWTINKEIWPHVTPLKISKGDQVEMVYTNNSGMSHPMHLHGHVFQVTRIDGKPITNGPLHDTILVMPHSSKTIVFNADNPGIWPMHCHVLYHMEAGMMTTTNYTNYPAPSFYTKMISPQK